MAGKGVEPRLDEVFLAGLEDDCRLHPDIFADVIEVGGGHAVAASVGAAWNGRRRGVPVMTCRLISSAI